MKRLQKQKQILPNKTKLEPSEITCWNIERKHLAISLHLMIDTLHKKNLTTFLKRQKVNSAENWCANVYQILNIQGAIQLDSAVKQTLDVVSVLLCLHVNNNGYMNNGAYWLFAHSMIYWLCEVIYRRYERRTDAWTHKFKCKLPCSLANWRHSFTSECHVKWSKSEHRVQHALSFHMHMHTQYVCFINRSLYGAVEAAITLRPIPPQQYTNGWLVADITRTKRTEEEKNGSSAKQSHRITSIQPNKYELQLNKCSTGIVFN